MEINTVGKKVIVVLAFPLAHDDVVSRKREFQITMHWRLIYTHVLVFIFSKPKSCKQNPINFNLLNVCCSNDVIFRRSYFYLYV